MAQGWTPPRSRLYSAPLHGAVADIAAQMGDELRARSNEEIDAERIRQLSNGRLALMKERNSLFTKIQKEQARTTDQWVPTLRNSWPAIEKGVLSGVTQPQAKQALQLEMSEARQKWEMELDNAARQQDAENLAADITAGLDGFYKESIEFTDYAHMQSYLAEGLRLLETAHNPGGLPVLDGVATKEQLDFEKRRMTRHILGNWLVQAALTADDENVLDHANDLVPEGIFEKGAKPLFGPDELADLHQRFDRTAKAAKAEVAKARAERAAAFETQVTKWLLTGQFMVPDEKGKLQNVFDLIVANPDISPDTMRTLAEKYDTQTNRLAQGKTYTELEKFEAYIKARTQTDPKKFVDTLYEIAPIIGFNEVQTLYDKKKDGAGDDSHMARRLNETVTAIRKLRAESQPEKLQKKTAEVYIDSMRTENHILRQWDAHPEWTDEEKTAAAEAALQPVKDETGKRTVKSVVQAAWGMTPLAHILARGKKEGKETEPVDMTRPTVRVTTKAEYDALPSGTRYLHPDGTVKVKR